MFLCPYCCSIFQKLSRLIYFSSLFNFTYLLIWKHNGERSTSPPEKGNRAMHTHDIYCLWFTCRGLIRGAYSWENEYNIKKWGTQFIFLSSPIHFVCLISRTDFRFNLFPRTTTVCSIYLLMRFFKFSTYMLSFEFKFCNMTYHDAVLYLESIILYYMFLTY